MAVTSVGETRIQNPARGRSTRLRCSRTTSPEASKSCRFAKLTFVPTHTICALMKAAMDGAEHVNGSDIADRTNSPHRSRSRPASRVSSTGPGLSHGEQTDGTSSKSSAAESGRTSGGNDSTTGWPSWPRETKRAAETCGLEFTTPQAS